MLHLAALLVTGSYIGQHHQSLNVSVELLYTSGAPGGETHCLQVRGADDAASPSSTESGDEVDQRRLQLYERSRLRYYYAVVDCQDVRTAAHLYAECDGIEFLRSACKLDMRFVPDDQV